MTGRGLRAAFVVQGEGRGHFTQALALAGHLRAAGHEITEVWVGRSPLRPVPDYFLRRIGAPVVGFRAPMLVPDRARRAVSAVRTAATSLLALPAFTASTLRLAAGLSARRFDVVVNFYDFLAGLSRMLRLRAPPSVCVAHHYVMGLPGVRVPSGAVGRIGLANLGRGSALRARRLLALSFDELRSRPGSRVTVVPPLLRPEVERAEPSAGSHLLAYALNPGYARELAGWQERHPEAEVRCFVEGGPRGAGVPERPGLTFHELDDRAFLEALASCRAYVGSAGFESVCEAHYLGKPTLVVPTAGHYEQRFNATDAERAGVARAGSYHDLDDFWSDPPIPGPEVIARFRAWVARGPSLVVEEIERAARR